MVTRLGRGGGSSHPGCACAVALAIASPVVGQYAHFESPHVHPLEMTPDGSKLLAVNTAAALLEIFTVNAGTPAIVHLASIPVGVEPVSVRARTDTEAWVVNQVSDSITVVDLSTLTVQATILTGDEPFDVVFAGNPQKAFVSASEVNRVEVYNPSSLGSAPSIVNIQGEDPRALATDGTRVWVAIFQCGNNTTIVPQATVSSTVNPYPGDPNPPPNAGSGFSPPIAAGLPVPPKVGVIVRKDAAGKWRDVNSADWSAAVTWNLHGNDMAVIDAQSLSVSYVKGLMTTPMAVAPLPGGGVAVVGTEAKNEIRFESNVKGIFIRVEGAIVPIGAATPNAVTDLNPHLDYSTPTVPQATRDLSIGDPRGVAASSDGGTLWVTGMGSNTLCSFTSGFVRSGQVDVGDGPTGIVNDAAHGRLFVLNRFSGTISVVDPAAMSESAQIPFFDPTPAVVKSGRPFLYDTHISSGLGQISCASCHLDGHTDQLAWDLGDPQGSMQAFSGVCNLGILGGCTDYHPMKGPMTTQPLVGTSGLEPFHWRGDRANLGAFAHAAQSLMGNDHDFTQSEMDKLGAFLATVKFPPNPNRNLDGSLKTSLAGGNPVTGQTLFNTGNLDFVQCVTCHALPAGSGPSIISANLLGEPQEMNIPQIRDMYEKTGFDFTSQSNNRGFGFTHDGGVDTLFDFLKASVFNFASGATGDQQRKDVAAFVLSFDTGAHASVGAQATLGGATPNVVSRRDQLVTIANTGVVQLIARGRVGGLDRGYLYTGSNAFKSDRANETTTLAALDAAAAAGSTITYTLVLSGMGTMLALDLDGDGYYNRDELDACSDPADPNSWPGHPGCVADLNHDGVINGADLGLILAKWGQSGSGGGDLNCDGIVDGADLGLLLGNWGACN